MTSQEEKDKLLAEHAEQMDTLTFVANRLIPSMVRQKENIDELVVRDPGGGDPGGPIDTTPPKLRGLTIQTTKSSVTVKFTTDELATVRILDQNGAAVIQTSTLRTEHDYTIDTLSPGTDYNYDLEVADTFDNKATSNLIFRTKDDVVVPPTGGGTMASQVTDRGVVFKFDKQYKVGQFITGDWWVVGPVRINEMTPNFGGGKHGAMLNPDSRSGQSYGTVGDNGYNASGNVATQLPKTFNPGDSIVKAVMPNSPYNSKNRPALQSCSILSVVSQPQATTAFRPAYSGTNAPIYDSANLNMSLLKNIDPAPGMPSISEIKSHMQWPWLDHVPNWPGRSIHPRMHMKDYGRDLCTEMGIVALAMHCNNVSDADKRILAIHLAQWGIDLWGIVENGGRNTNVWGENGGHSQGRKWPIMFAGHMLNIDKMKRLGQDIWFCEEHQTLRVTQQMVGNSAYTNNADKRSTIQNYTANMVGWPEWGIRARIRTNELNANWTAIYRQCCTANSWWGQLLACMLMGLREDWNYDVLFEYQDRYRAVQKTRSDASWNDSWHPWMLSMWDKHRPALASKYPVWKS